VGNSEELRVELDRLLKEQRDALQVEIFGGLTDEERRQYDQRHERIRELYSKLCEQKAAA
jgi:hypothetical protein